MLHHRAVHLVFSLVSEFFCSRPPRPACGILAPIPGGGGDAAGDAVTTKSMEDLPARSFVTARSFSPI